MKITLETLTQILPDIAPEIEPVTDGSKVGFYRFKSGPYEGIVFTYANIRFTPNEEDDYLQVGFQYIIIQDPKGNQPKNQIEDDVFKQKIGEILIKIIDAAVQEDVID